MKTIPRIKRLAGVGANHAFVDRDLSPAAGVSMWDGVPLLAMRQDPSVGICLFEDFLSLPLDDTTGDPTNGKFISDTAANAITLVKAAAGVMSVACGGVDNNETYFQIGGAGSDTHAPFVIEDGNEKPLWFEVYAKALEHADEGVFIGLAEEGAAAANFLADDTGVPGDKDFVGFRLKADAPDEWDVAWRLSGQAEQEVANVVENADDWHRFGFYFDGIHTVTFYVDRVAVGTAALTSAATFPSGELMAPLFAVKTGEGVAKSIQVDYIWIAQVR